MPRLQRAKTCIQAVEKGAAHLVSLQAQDGSLGENAATTRACHKAVLAMVNTGRLEEVQRLLEWIKGRYREGNGAVDAPHPVAAWIIIGAHLSGRLDLSLPAAAHVAHCQGKGTGGIYETENGRRRSCHHLCSTAAGGLALLTCGRISAAWQAGAFLRRALGLQPRGNRFYACFDHRARPVADADEGDAPDPNSVLNKSQSGQQYEILGLPELFLAKLHLATGDEDFLNAAKGYAHLAHRVEQDIWRSLAGCMSAWGEAILYRLTRRRRYLRFAERLVGHLIDGQHEDGSWHPQAAEGEEPTPEAVVDATATALLTLTECLREVQ